jgi:DNA modification methylase
LKPKSVLDPFLGSGTTAEVCSQLKVSWLGFEIKVEYKADIEKRISFGKSHPIKFLSAMKSRSIDKWLG